MSNDESIMNTMLSERRAAQRPPARNGVRRFHRNNSNSNSNNSNNNTSSTSSNSTIRAVNRLTQLGRSLIDGEKIVSVSAYEQTTGLVFQNGRDYIASSDMWRIGAGAANSLIDLNFTTNSVGYIDRAGNFGRVTSSDAYGEAIPSDISGGYKFKKLIRGIGESYLGLTNDNHLINIGERHGGIPAVEMTPVLTASAWRGGYSEASGFAVVVYVDGSVTQFGDIVPEAGEHVEEKPADLLLKAVGCGDGFCVGIDNEDRLVAWGNYVKKADGSADVLQKIVDGITYTPLKVVCGYYNLIVIDTDNLLHVYEIVEGDDGVEPTGVENDIPEPYKSIKVLNVAAAHIHFVAITDEHKAYVSLFDFSKVYAGDETYKNYYFLPPKYTDSRILAARRDLVIRVSANEGVSTAVTYDGMVYVWGDAGMSHRNTQLGHIPRFDSQPVKVIASKLECAALLDTGAVQYWTKDGSDPATLPEDKTYNDIVAGGHFIIGLGDDSELYSNRPLHGPTGQSLDLPHGPFKKIFSNGLDVCIFVRDDNSLVIFTVGKVYGPSDNELAGVHDFFKIAIYQGPDYLQFAGVVEETGDVMLWGKLNAISGFPTKGLYVTRHFSGLAVINKEDSELYVAELTNLNDIHVLKPLSNDIKLSLVEGGPHLVCITNNGYVVSLNYTNHTSPATVAGSEETATPIGIVEPRYRNDTELYYQERVDVDDDDDGERKEAEDDYDSRYDNNNSYRGGIPDNIFDYGRGRYSSSRRLDFGSAALGEYFNDDSELRADKAVVEPSLTKLSDVTEILRPTDKSVFDFADGTDYDTYGEYLEEEQADAIIFKVGDNLMGFSKSRLAAVIQDGSAIFYECRKVFPFNPGAGEFGTFDPQDIKRASFTVLTLNGRFFIKTAELLPLIFSTHQFFELAATEISVPVSASRDAAVQGGPLVSANHCQDGTDIKLHSIKPIKFVRSVAAAAEPAVVEMKVYIRRGNEETVIYLTEEMSIADLRRRYATIKGVDESRVKLIAPGRFPKNTNITKPGDRFMAIIKNVPAVEAPVESNENRAWRLGYGGGKRKTRRKQRGAGYTRRIRSSIPLMF